MRRRTSLGLLTFSLATAFGLTPRVGVAQSPAGEGQDLVNDLSRGDLFELIKQADERDDPSLIEEGVRFFNLYGPFRYPNDVVFDVVQAKPRVDSIFGVDISHHNKDGFAFEDFERKRVRFVFAKATQGTGFKDRKFPIYWQKLANQKVHRGAYHFLSARSDGGAQGEYYMRFLTTHGGLKATDMPPVVDLEWDKTNINAPDAWADKTPDQILNSLKEWLNIVEQRTGRKPMVYTARSWWRERIGSEARISKLADYPLWIADYSRSSRAIEVPRVPANAPWALWQYTDAASFAAGYDGKFDSNIFKGTEESFYTAFGLDRF